MITPGTSTVALLKTKIREVARFDSSRTQRQVNAFICLDYVDFAGGTVASNLTLLAMMHAVRTAIPTQYPLRTA